MAEKKILLDTPTNRPALGYEGIATAFAGIIANSQPNFAIGIFGSWGSGKTTLMGAIKTALPTPGVLTVDFNAWRFEREPQLLVPLLDTIRGALASRAALEELGKVNGEGGTADVAPKLRRIAGRVGGSDLEGALTVDDTTGRMDATGALSSHRMRIADLIAVVGGSARHASPAELSPLQKAEAAKLQAEHRILPDVPLQVDRLRGMDADATYSATLVDAGHFPMRDFRMHVRLDHGVLAIDPLSVDIAQGRLAGMIRLDARHTVPTSAIDLRLSGAQLGPLIKTKGPNPPIEAGLWARARLQGTGASVRAAAAHANGSVTAVLPSGALRKTIGNLINFNLDRTAFLLITKNKKDTPIHCAVMDFKAQEGLLTIDEGVMDTGEAQILGTGDVSLRDETLNLRFAAKPKKFSIIHLNAPITLTGRFDAPKPGVDIVHAIPQAAGAVALGVVAAPLAAVLPFVGPGLAHNADCQALVSAAEAPRRPTPPAKR